MKRTIKSFTVVLCALLLYCTYDFMIEDFEGITETDGYGRRIGDVDIRDWSGYEGFTSPTSCVAKNIAITAYEVNFEYSPNVNIQYDTLKIFNFSYKEIVIKAIVDSPVFVEHDSIIIKAGSTVFLNVYFKGYINFTNDSLLEQFSIISLLGDSALINVMVNSPIGVHIPMTFVYAAYPNPASGLVVLNFRLKNVSNVHYKIIDRDGNLVRTLMNYGTPRGFHNIFWDLEDNNGNRVKPDLYRAIFETEDYEVYGDILVVD